MILKRISILNYKNLEQVELSFSPKLNCFFGQNGMGKTNLLDAIYFLSFCKSSGNPIDSQNIRHDQEFFVIQGFYEALDGTPEEIYCGMKRRQKKQFKRNKKEYTRLSDHIGFLPLVMVSPADSELIAGGSDERRRFMDVVISQYDKEYLEALIRYNKALAQRNTLLKSEVPVEDIGFVVWNKNQHSNDYENIKNLFRPSHADYTYMQKYGIRDYRGGGRSSARETISRVVAGALAKLALKQLGISVTAYTSQVGPVKLDKDYKSYNLDLIETNDVRCPDPEKAKEMAELIWKIKGEGDTIGGVVSCVIKGCPIGLGQPVFGKLHAALGNAMLSINAVKGFSYGQGFDSMELKGSEQNDVFYNNNGRVETKSNYSGGIQGGISNGQDIYFRVAFKPVATILMEQHTVNINGTDTTMKAKGRHDACVLPRAVPIVEAMAAMTILDYYLIDRTTQL